MNDDTYTFLSDTYGTQSAIDLTILNPEIVTDFSWRVLEDLHGSDHFPILVESLGPSPYGRESRWNLRKADWESFQNLCLERLNPDLNLSIEDFTKILIEIADKTIPKSSTHPKRITNPWFNEKCRVAIRERRKAQDKMVKHPMPHNIIEFKMKRAIARRTIRETKRESWRQFVSKLSSNTSLSKIWALVRKMKGKGSASNQSHLTHN